MAAVDILDTTQVVSQVQIYTGDVGSAAMAGGYAALISSVTGSGPLVKNLGNGRAALTVSDAQAQAMRNWLNDQYGGILQGTREQPKLETPFGKIVGPWAMQQAIPVVLAAVLTGWIAHWWVSK